MSAQSVSSRGPAPRANPAGFRDPYTHGDLKIVCPGSQAVRWPTILVDRIKLEAVWPALCDMITRSEDDSCAELHLHCSRAAALLLLDAVMNPHVDPIPGRDCSSGKLLAAIEVARDYKLHGATRHLMYQLCAADRGDMRFEVFVRACQLDVQLASVVLSLAAAGEVPNKRLFWALLRAVRLAESASPLDNTHAEFWRIVAGDFLMTMNQVAQKTKTAGEGAGTEAV
ncbi:uncharacterized protein MKK02DRAFT_42073 [Dioszegia hungarica]|uniref:Uncharacterized protein n=1 Tax=Dioszegia hungarica TaxID=4972 RepID=A0AA38LYH3_9TREE|nr:uncharacterized protein MKK02DRAFT_42073 [Dioszegia hungarica]KAI9639031.1 hypothetical protein MKK02DRAFT_42073 [Dioszegia hungarica]